MSDFAQQLHRKNAYVLGFYFSKFDDVAISPALLLNQNAISKERGSWVLSKLDFRKLQRVYTQGVCLYESVQNLVRASNLPVTKLRQFLRSKHCCTEMNLAKREFKRKNGVWQLQNRNVVLAYVEKLAKVKKVKIYFKFVKTFFERTPLMEME